MPLGYKPLPEPMLTQFYYNTVQYACIAQFCELYRSDWGRTWIKVSTHSILWIFSGLILGLRPANETLLQSNAVSHWQGPYLESVLILVEIDSVVMGTILYILLCHYNAVNFLENFHERHPIARPLGRGMGCLLWVHTLISILSWQQQRCDQYHGCYIGLRYDDTQL